MTVRTICRGGSSLLWRIHHRSDSWAPATPVRNIGSSVLRSHIPGRRLDAINSGRPGVTPQLQAFQKVCSHAVQRHSSTASTKTAAQPQVLCYYTRTRAENSTIANITISNPSKLNIVNEALLQQFTKICNDLSSDASLRAVILTGADTSPGKARAFIGGADIKTMQQLGSSEEAREFISHIHAACEALRNLPVPVIARVHGVSLGAGLEIMAACDLRVATKQSVFGMPEVKVGIPSVVEAALLPGLIGMGRTRRLLYLAETIDAVEAERWGLVEKVVEDEAALDACVKHWVDLLVGMGPKAIRAQKRLMQVWETSGLEEGIQAGVDAFAEAYSDGGVEPKKFMGKFVDRKR